jgi:twitching motility protein PilT
VHKGAGDPIEIGRMGPPASVGEMGLLLEETRTASVVAASEVLAMKFGAKAFEAMFQKIPAFGMGLSKGLAHRLQQVSGKVPLPDYDATEGRRPAAEVIELLPVELVQRHRVMPLKLDGNRLTIGFVDDPTPQVMTAVRGQLPALELRPVHIDVGLFNDVLGSHSGVKKQAADAAAPAEAKAGGKSRSPYLDQLLVRMVGEGASDLHLSAGAKPIWRIDGEMSSIDDAAVLGETEVWDMLEPVMAMRHRVQFGEDNDTDLAYDLPGVARFRVNVFRDNRGVGAVLRQIPSKIMTFEQLSLPPVLKAFCDMPKGLVLVTGPTGSGKSTTLAAMVDYINRSRADHIITMEDPIEFVHPNQKCLINQREVGGHTTSFGRALRAALREDPDIALVGEMRDLETIALALETANTGHLVFATLHTNSAISSVDRVIDMFPANQQAQIRSVFADVLKGVVSQTLVKKRGGGRVAAIEVMVVNYAVQNLIREHKTVQITSVMQTGKAAGNQMLGDELARLVEERKVDYEEAYFAAVDKDDFQRRFRTGMMLANDPPAYEKFRVTSVEQDSPAHAAGFARGDLIVEINRKPAKEFSLEDIRFMLRTDGKYEFQVERGGKRRPVTMELRGKL